MAVSSTAIWRVRPSGNNANGGGFDQGIASPGTDRSQQNAAQVTFNGTTITATTAGVGATITFSGGTGYTATSADIANCLHITGGTNFIAGWYFITAQAGTTWTLDRNCTTGAGAAMTGNMGGGWADFVTNTTSSGPTVNGNTVYILGAGTPNPASYTPDYTVSATWTPLAGDDFGAGYVTFANDPGTPGYKAWPDTTGGMPLIRNTFAGTFANLSGQTFQGLWFYVESGFTTNNFLFNSSVGGHNNFEGCVFDQNGIDGRMVGGNNMRLYGCELFSSSGSGGGSTGALFFANSSPYHVDSCNIHDCVGTGILLSNSGPVVINTIIAKCSSFGIDFQNSADGNVLLVKNCTIDANGNSGIRLFHGSADLPLIVATNNIISNHATGNGILSSSGTAAVNAACRMLIDYNTFYNNTADLSANLAYGPHDIHGGSNPYVAQTTQNYTLA